MFKVSKSVLRRVGPGWCKPCFFWEREAEGEMLVTDSLGWAVTWKRIRFIHPVYLRKELDPGPLFPELTSHGIISCSFACPLSIRGQIPCQLYSLLYAQPDTQHTFSKYQ